jgi:glycosyltransferase involved in cell wall biosynthesis
VDQENIEQAESISVAVRICLIGATHLCHNPRLLREADSLSEAGHDVRVVTPSFTLALDQRDEQHLALRKWRHQKIDYVSEGLGGNARSIFMRGRRRMAFELHERFGGHRLAEYGYTTALPELRRQAMREPADWFIAHAHAALPAAAAAAHRWNARLGFDCEDLLAERETDPANIVRLIEKTYLSDCDYVSTPSQGIADRLQGDYGIEPPVVLYNVFPLHLAEGMSPPAERSPSPVLRLQWFGQTIGPGRGIEEAIEACGLLDESVELHLRGNPSAGFEAVLEALAAQHKVKLRLHPQIGHDDLIRSLSLFDVGLALERQENVGAALTVSNKIGSYLLAGLAIAASDTPGQREVLNQVPNAGFLYEAGKPELLAKGLQRWLDNRDAMSAAQQCAWDAARERFCWDIEKEKFLKLLGPSTLARLRQTA